MSTRYKVGDSVKTTRGAKLKVKGTVVEIVKPNKDLRMLWGSKDVHYIVKDTWTGECVSVIERGLEQI